jgi:hypothetical protein
MINQSDTIGKLAEALSKFQGELDGVAKTSQGYNYQYADLSAVWATIRKPLTKHGLAVTQTTAFTDDGSPVVITTLLHTSGEWLTGELLVKPLKLDPQSLGSAVTYGRRYGLMAILGVAPEEDDGAAASKPAKRSKPKQQKRSVTQIEPDTELRERFDVLWNECVKAGIDTAVLTTINPKSTPDQIKAAGIANKEILDTINK